MIRAATSGGPGDVFVHAINPPGCHHWDQLVLPMIDNPIAAAWMAGAARIGLPGRPTITIPPARR